MTGMNYLALQRRYTEAYTWQLNWMALYQQFWWWVCPNRNALNMINSFRNDGMPLTMAIWDDTAPFAARQRANDLVSLMIPKDRRWGQLTFNPHFVAQQDITANQAKLDDVNESIFWYLNNSNLYRAAGSSALDLNSGTGCLYVESVDDDNPLVFHSIPAICVFIEATYNDLVGTVWIKRNFSPVDFLAKFPKYRGTRYDALAGGASNMMVPVIYGQIQMAQDKYFMYAVVEGEWDNPLFENERDYNQIIVFRDQVRPGEPNGRGVGIDLLPTIQDLNHTVRDRRKLLDFTANPPMFYDADDAFNPFSVRQWSGAFIPRSSNGRNPLEPLVMPANPDVWNQIQDSREMIRRGFQVDPLGDINMPTKTATEIAARENRAQRSTVTDLGRLENEFPKQIYEISVRILMERGLINLKFMNKKNIKFEWQSPLTDLQKEEDLGNFIQNLQIKQQFFGPGSVIASVNLGEVNDYMTKQLNLPSRLFKNRDEVEQMMLKGAEQSMPQASTTAQAVEPMDSAQIERVNVSAGPGQ